MGVGTNKNGGCLNNKTLGKGVLEVQVTTKIKKWEEKVRVTRILRLMKFEKKCQKQKKFYLKDSEGVFLVAGKEWRITGCYIE